MSGHLIESLESRLAMSVSGYSLGNFNTGTVLTYNNTTNGQAAGKLVYTVTGPKTVKHVSVITTTGVQTYSGGSSTQVNDFITSPAEGQLLYRVDSVTKGSDTTRLSSTFSDPKSSTILPRKLVGGSTYNYSWTLNNTGTTNGGSPTSYSYATTFSVHLRSEKSRRVTAAGHTFHCYILDETTTFTISGQKQTINTTEYVSPGVGLIEQSTVSILSTSHVKTYSGSTLAAYTLM